jgi:hypothetical protein
VDENLLKICFVNFKLGLNINPLKSNLRWSLKSTENLIFDLKLTH